MKTLKQSLVLLLGLILFITGFIFSIRSGLGVMLLFTFPHTLSLVTNASIAFWCFLFFACLIGLQFLLKIKPSKETLTMQIVTVVAFSVLLMVLNRVLRIVHPYTQYPVKLTYMLFSLFFMSFGAAHIKLSGLIDGIMPDDAVARFAGLKKKPVFNVKAVFYLILIVASIILSLMFTKRLESFREASVFYLIAVPPLMKYFTALFEGTVSSFINRGSEETEPEAPMFIPTAVEAINEADIADIINSIKVEDIAPPEAANNNATE